MNKHLLIEFNQQIQILSSLIFDPHTLQDASLTPKGEVRSYEGAYQLTAKRLGEGVTPIVNCTMLAIGKESPHFNIATHAEA
jgi:hypothetical protein